MARSRTSRPSNPMQELGVAGDYARQGYMKMDEFLPQLRGSNAIKKYREMRENDPIIGSIMTAMDMIIRAIEVKFVPPEDKKDDEQAKEYVQFMKEVFSDMDGTMEEFLSEVLSFLVYGFAIFEVVYKRRMGTNSQNPQYHSMYNDGRIAIRKLSPRAQWTIDRFEMSPNGDILGVYQNAIGVFGSAFIPVDKMLHFRTVMVNNDPSGRSVLRNAYKSYHYANNLETIEAIAIEREMNGLPIGRVPAEYLAENATPAQKNFVRQYQSILRNVRNNEMSFILLPSDVYQNDNGSSTQTAKVSFELAASKGTRDIDIDKVIRRHQHNIARTVLADFIMLGGSDRGSFALSQSKTDLFLRAIEGFTGAISSVINAQLIPRIWSLNGLDFAYMPKFSFGRVSPIDMEELGRFVARLAGANEDIFRDEAVVSDVLDKAGIPMPKDMKRVTQPPQPKDPAAPPPRDPGNIEENDPDPLSQQGSRDLS